jgi:threonine dehydrogenase-like Zn-dependent dehydrogenase
MSPHQKMHALQITKPGLAEIKDLPIPEPEAGEFLLEIEAISTCPHWDRHIFEGKPMFAGMKLEYPWWPGQPGHEAIGRVVHVGCSDKAEWIGRRVAVWRDAGPYRKGLYATHGIVPRENVIEIPENLEPAKIASLELAMCVQVSIDQLNEIDAIVGKKVALSGLGPAGLVALQLLKRAGAAEIWAIDPQADRRALALQLGADHAVAPGDSSLPSSRTADNAFHAALDTTGLPVSIEALMAASKRAVAIFGVLRDPVQFTPAQWYGGFSLIGYGEHNHGAAERALEAVLAGDLDLSPLITHSLPLSEYAEGVALLQSMEAIKVLFDPTH